MKISARNVFRGAVTGVTAGAVNAEVELTLPGGDTLVAIVTEASIRALGLAVGKEAVAYVKAPWVIVLTGAGLFLNLVRACWRYRGFRLQAVVNGERA